MNSLLTNHAFRALVGVLGVTIIIQVFIVAPPRDFPEKQIVPVKEGQTVEEIAENLTKRHIVRHPFFFTVYLIFWGKDDSLVAGDYFFERKRNMFRVIDALTTGDYGIESTKVTVPEGLHNRQVASLLKKFFPTFDEGIFLLEAGKKEGYLFPDTYFFLPMASPGEIIDEMYSNFTDKIKHLEAPISASGRTLHEIITMASILEEEVRSTKNRKIIAGILWKRLDAGMLLQVDAPFQYFLGRNSFTVTLDDLANDSPYNTYKHKGLPPGPISNPSLDAIISSVYYEETPYWFYLSDFDNNVHYAKTFEEHKENKRQYLP